MVRGSTTSEVVGRSIPKAASAARNLAISEAASDMTETHPIPPAPIAASIEKVSIIVSKGSLEGIYPASIVFDGFALNLTLVTCGDNVDFGITACPVKRSLHESVNVEVVFNQI